MMFLLAETFGNLVLRRDCFLPMDFKNIYLARSSAPMLLNDAFLSLIKMEPHKMAGNVLPVTTKLSTLSSNLSALQALSLQPEITRMTGA